MTVAVSSPYVDQLLVGLMQPGGREDPYPRYEALRRSAPIAVAADGAFVITRHADCSAVLHDARYGRADNDDVYPALGLPDWREHPGIWTLSTSMLSINPPDHTRLRRLVNRAFTPRQVARLEGVVAGLVDTLLDRLAGDQPLESARLPNATTSVRSPARSTDFMTEFAFALPVAVIGELLGIPAGDWPAFQPLVRDWTMLLDVFTPEVLQRGDTAAAEIRRYLGELVNERRKLPGDDLLTALVTARDAEDRLSEDELVTTAALLFAAGFETTTHLLGNGLVALLAHPDQFELLRTRPDLAASAAEELLRYDSPVQISGRTALVDAEVDGVPVARGKRVVCYLGAANRDPDRFSQPDDLDLTRSPNAPMSFGGGIHYCLGAPLARLEARIAFPALVERYPGIHLTEAPERRDSLTLRGYLRLPVSTG